MSSRRADGAAARLVVWVPAGSPSMAQAAAEWRDRIEGSAERGAVRVLIEDGEAAPLASRREGRAPRAAVGAELLLALVEGPGAQAPRVEVDVDDEAARAAARTTGAMLIVRAAERPPGARASGIGAPLVVWRDGVAGTVGAIDREVVERARALLDGTARRLGLVAGRRPRVPSRVVLRTRVVVEGGADRGVVELAVRAGEVVRRGEALALLGGPGPRREVLPAPEGGVVLEAGTTGGRARIIIARAERSLDRLARHLPNASPSRRLIVGYCEHVGLPELGIELAAKIDTGARSCALHVLELEIERDGPEGPGDGTARFRVAAAEAFSRVPIAGFATVRDSGGRAHRRPVIETSLRIGGRTRRVRVTLADRGDMRFAMLIGRSALGGEIAIDPAGRWLAGRPGGGADAAAQAAGGRRRRRSEKVAPAGSVGS